MCTVDLLQTKFTSVIKKTLNPNWNESFDLYVQLMRGTFYTFITLTALQESCGR